MRQPIPFGKYYLLERINVGGMAEVFKAKATGVEGFERLVAVKRILPSIAEDDEFITMFVDEAKIAVQLTHANIGQIFDLGRVDGSFFIALEYVHGKDLRAMFNRARQRGELLAIPLSCYAIMKVCEGLDYAHNKYDASGTFLNLVHRDVSPQNILVSYEGEVKIIDFGIAKVVNKSGRTQAGILKGKFGYMSPEQVQGLEIDRRSDVFGVGICLYELLTGERLFVAESDFATLEKVRAVDIMPPSTYNRRIPEELEQIVMRALARDRDERYQTAMQLHDDLQAFMHTSANLFSRKDLSAYMHRVFAEEIEKESARDREYASLESLSGDEAHDASGLGAFSDVAPINAVGGLNSAEPYGVVASRPAPGGHARKATLMGMTHLGARTNEAMRGQSADGAARRPPSSADGAARRPPSSADGAARRPPSSADGAARRPPSSADGAARRPPSVPRLIPNPGSVPALPPRSSRSPSRPSGLHAAGRSQPPLPGQGQHGHHGPHGMEWDDEELSTQLYDKPDDILPPLASQPAFNPALSRSQPAQRSQSARPVTGTGPNARVGTGPNPRVGTGPQPRALPQPPASLNLTTESLPWEQPPKGRPMLVAILAVVAIVGCIVLGLMLFGQREPGTVHLTTVPGRVSVTVDGKPLGMSTSPFVISELSAGKRHSIAVSSPGYQPWSNSVELQSGQVLALPEVQLTRIETGFSLDSVPTGATAFLDGQRLTQATPLRVIDLSPGEHRIRLEQEGFAPWESVVHANPGTVLPLDPVTLQPMAAEPSATSSGRWSRWHRARSSGADSTTDSSSSEAAGPSEDQPAQVAKPTQAEEPPEPEVESAAEAEPENDAPKASASADAKGTLRVNTRPWSQIFIDGKASGTTPRMNIPLPAGPHTLLFVNEEFGIRKSVDVTIEPGKVETIVLNLAE